MAHNIKALSVQTNGRMVFVRDEKGNNISVMEFPQAPLAQSFGNGITVTCGGMCFTYELNDSGQLVQVGSYGI